jgi:hypothetical protein
LSLAATLVLQAIALIVRGGSLCPSPDQVVERLNMLNPRAGASTKDDAADVLRAEVDEDASRIRVRLTNDSGAVLGERDLPRDASCTDLASAAAVVLATWIALEGGHPLALQPVSEPSPSPPTNATDAPREPRGAAAAQGDQIAAPETRPAAPIVVAVGASAFASYASSIAPGGSLEVVIRRFDLDAADARSRLGLRFAASVATPRSSGLDAGHFAWIRPTLSAGVVWRWTSWSAFALESRAAGNLALLRVEGSGFTTNRTSIDSDPGFEAALRAILPAIGAVRPYLEIAGLGWVRAQELSAVGGSEVKTLPRLELLGALGFSVDLSGGASP